MRGRDESFRIGARRGRAELLALGMSLGIAPAWSCANRGEPAACLDNRQEARNLALRGDVEQAQVLLERVKTECGPNSASDIAHISKLIAEKTAVRLDKQRSEARQQALRKEFPSRDFIQWATLRGGDLEGKLATTECAERSSADYGFCAARRSEAPNMSVRYWNLDKGAYRYALTTREPPSCQDLGEYRQVRVWSRDGNAYELCELTNRRLRHLSALLVRTPSEHQMYIFSQEYLAHDPEFERSLRVVSPVR